MGVLLRKCAELCFRTDQDAEILLRASTEKMKKEWQNAEKAMIQEKKSPESLTIQQLYVYLEQARGKVEKTFPCPDEKIC